jgi:hypothetical protein
MILIGTINIGLKSTFSSWASHWGRVGCVAWDVCKITILGSFGSSDTLITIDELLVARLRDWREPFSHEVLLVEVKLNRVRLISLAYPQWFLKRELHRHPISVLIEYVRHVGERIYVAQVIKILRILSREVSWFGLVETQKTIRRQGRVQLVAKGNIDKTCVGDRLNRKLSVYQRLHFWRHYDSVPFPLGKLPDSIRNLSNRNRDVQLIIDSPAVCNV